MATSSKTTKKTTSPKAGLSEKPAISTPATSPVSPVQEVSPSVSDTVKTTKTSVKETVEKRETVPAEKTETKEVQSVTFYGRTIRKFFDKKWYFAIEDILALAKSDDGLKTPPRKTNFEDVKKKVTKLMHNDLYAEASGCMALMREIDGTFPGSLGRWLNEA